MRIVNTGIALPPRRQTTTRPPPSSVGVDDFTLDYEPVGRYGESSSLRLSIPPATGERKLLIWLSRSYLESIVLEGIAPDIRGVQMTRDRVVMCFATEEDGGLEVEMRFTFDRPGLIAGRIGLECGSSLSFAQHVMP